MEIRVGVMVPPLDEQLFDYGYKIAEPGMVEYLQRDINSILRLYGNGTMTLSEANRCWRRVINKAVRNMTRIEEGDQ